MWLAKFAVNRYHVPNYPHRPHLRAGEPADGCRVPLGQSAHARVDHSYIVRNSCGVPSHPLR